MIKLLKNKDGNVAIQAVVVVLVFLLVFSVVSEYLRLQMIAQGVRDAVQSAVISVATENYDEVYNGLREGYSGGYTLYDDIWVSRIDEGAVMSELTLLLGLNFGQKYAGGELEYELTDLDVTILNAPLAPSINNDRFESEIYLTLTVPISFGWEQVPDMEIRLKVNAGYTPKF
ncbi:conserved protein of unknown function [Petrocella atlantisensis]|uniref:Uncharacterized protein n=1 Tax=Petrocella atlantisensis TaxID=2173034 RepID=A0A3P7S3H7_9FIRM|nr:hypothetical protein [Petrocella atlantisensis]VDN47289.1 conserved protein of unknown function [Petrocella atlantisensis]